MIHTLLPWATSALTLLGIYIVGRKNWWGWVVGIANQALWVWFALTFHAYGILGLAACLTVLYIKNLIQWRQAERTTRWSERALAALDSLPEIKYGGPEPIRLEDWDTDKSQPVGTRMVLPSGRPGTEHEWSRTCLAWNCVPAAPEVPSLGQWVARVEFKEEFDE